MNRRSEPGKISVRVPSDIKYIKEISSGILKWVGSRRLDDSTLFDIRLCCEEMILNAMKHGNRGDKNAHVSVSYWLEGDALIVEVEDEGKGFDSGKVPDPTTEDNLMKGSGRGVYLARKLMDKMEYNEKGNKVRITKYLK